MKVVNPTRCRAVAQEFVGDDAEDTPEPAARRQQAFGSSLKPPRIQSS